MDYVLGFIGTGHIASAVIKGLLKDKERPFNIVVSPRNKDIALALSQQFSTVTVAGSNQEVLDRSDVVFIAVLPNIVAGST